MDRCLQIPEVLRLICDQIPNGDSYNRRRLFVTALSCRALLEPALDSLWFSLQGIEPLISCLPEDLLMKEMKKGGGGSASTLKYTHVVSLSTPFTLAVPDELKLGGFIRVYVGP